MISSHLPALQVVLPLISAPVCVLIRKGLVAWMFAVAVSWITFVIALALLVHVVANGPLSYAMGGWAAPYGIVYRIDLLTAFVLIIVAGMGALVTTSAFRVAPGDMSRDHQNFFFGIFLLVLTGLLGITVTGDAFNLYVFLEISSLASYALVALGRDRRALMAAFQYLIMGTIGATFILAGIGLLYAVTGTLNMEDLAQRLQQVDDSRAVKAAFAFIVVGASLKLALFPLHAWLPNAYTHAPALVSAFLAATATKVGVYVLVRFIYTVFGGVFSFETMSLGPILMVFGLCAALVSSLVAIFQENVKRMFAYSSVAQIGYMVLGLSFASHTGLTAAIVHIFNHAAMKGALFLALACAVYRLGSVELSELRGLGRRMPITFACIVIAGLSLIGVPLTGGFVSKWYLVSAALEQDLWLVAAAVLVSSLFAVVYVWRVVEVAYFQSPPDGKGARCEAPASLVIPTVALAVACIYFGIDTEPTVGVARAAANELLASIP